MFNSKSEGDLRLEIRKLEILVEDKQKRIDQFISLICRANKALYVQSEFPYIQPLLTFELYINKLERAQEQRVEEQNIRVVVEKILNEKSPKVPVDSCETASYKGSPSYKD